MSNNLLIVQESSIVSVSQEEEVYYVTTADGTQFGLKKKWKTIPRVGQHIKLYIATGGLIQGMDINHRRVYMYSDADLIKEQHQWAKDRVRELRQQFERNRPHLDALYQALPDVFKKRIDTFRNGSVKFRLHWEDMELYCCTLAVAIAKVMDTPAKVQEFSKLGIDEMIRLVPACASRPELRSISTFETALKLAYFYLQDPKKIEHIAGAMEKVVGPEAYRGPRKPGLKLLN